MRHPRAALFRQAARERRIRDDFERCRAEFAVLRCDDLAFEIARHQLHAVTDAEDRNARAVGERIDPEGVGAERALGAAGQHDRRRFAFNDLAPRRIVRQNFGVDVGLAHAARDQLAVLRAEIQDNHRGRPRLRVHGIDTRHRHRC